MRIPPRPSRVVVDLDHQCWTPRRPGGACNGETFLPPVERLERDRIADQRAEQGAIALCSYQRRCGRHLLGRQVPVSNARDEAAVSDPLTAASRFAVSISDLA